jgi:hypothetical protein
MRSGKVVLLILVISLLFNIALAVYSHTQRIRANANAIVSLEARVKLIQAEDDMRRQQQLAEMQAIEAQRARQACEAQLAMK